MSRVMTGPVMKFHEKAILCAESDEAFDKALHATPEEKLPSVIQWLHYSVYADWPKEYPQRFGLFVARVKPLVENNEYLRERLLEVCVRGQLILSPSRKRSASPAT